jgi:hypothetical protein
MKPGTHHQCDVFWIISAGYFSASYTRNVITRKDSGDTIFRRGIPKRFTFAGDA